jgi:hypothetical protein
MPCHTMDACSAHVQAFRKIPERNYLRTCETAHCVARGRTVALDFCVLLSQF